MKKFFYKYGHYGYFVVAILCLITFFVRDSTDNTIWILLFGVWLVIGFTSMVSDKDK